MNSRRRGGIIGAGIGVLALLVVVALGFWMMTKTAEAEHGQAKQAQDQSLQVQQEAQKLQKAMEKRAHDMERQVQER